MEDEEVEDVGNGPLRETDDPNPLGQEDEAVDPEEDADEGVEETEGLEDVPRFPQPRSPDDGPDQAQGTHGTQNVGGEGGQEEAPFLGLHVGEGLEKVVHIVRGFEWN